MLRYTEVGRSFLEVPQEIALCIYISGCINNCRNCHYPELKRVNYGTVLADNYKNIIDLYAKSVTCVCFLGEGKNEKNEHEELILYSSYARFKGLKTCLYSGRDTIIEKWMKSFDYIKIGRYIPEYGPLNVPTTNQRMYRKESSKYINITEQFWA